MAHENKDNQYLSNMFIQTLFATTLCGYYNNQGKPKEGSTVMDVLDVVSNVEISAPWLASKAWR